MARVSHPSNIMDENTLGEWSDGDDDWIWDVDENTLWEWSDDDDDWIWDVDDSGLPEQSDPEADDIIPNIQSGRGEKRKSDEQLLPEKDFYEKESVTKQV